jgi:hypothetical protein
MEKVNFVNAGTPEEFFAYVEKVKALHKANECFCQQGGEDDEQQGKNREAGTANDCSDPTSLQPEKATE